MELDDHTRQLPYMEIEISDGRIFASKIHQSFFP